MEMEKKSLIELKAILFDLQQEIIFKQNQIQRIGAILQTKLKEEEELKVPNDDSK